ncbi:MAG TPA: uroporphyrinogen-III synthase [Parvibaculum sp.]|jgi:uroporphyrinogen-III synthase
MSGKLDGLKILVPESRELDLFATMLEAEGGSVMRCPLVSILELEDRAEADDWISLFLRAPFDDLILLTGEGLRKLLALCERDDLETAFRAALTKTRTITRGPKPARVLRELGLAPNLSAPEPTSKGVLDALAEENLRGRRIGVQLYPGEGGLPLVAALRERGAEVFAVTPYRYASGEEAAHVADAIRAMAAGEIGVVAFTSTPQVERLAAVAREFGLESKLAQGLARTPVASIGPIMDKALAAHGVTAAIRPASSFHMKPLLRAIVAWRTGCD